MTSDFIQEFSKLGEDLLNFLSCGYLERNNPQLYTCLVVFGIISSHRLTGYKYLL